MSLTANRGSGGGSGRLVAVLVVLAVALATVPTPAVAAEDPNLSATVPEPRLDPGTTQTLTVVIENDAAEADEVVKTARDVSVEATAGAAPIEVHSGVQSVGTLTDGALAPVSLVVRVPRDARAGTYDVPLRVTYEVGDDRESTTIDARVVVPERPVFRVATVSSSLRVGERGTARVTLHNVGSAVARDVSVTLSTGSSALAIEGGASTVRFAGRMAPNESRTILANVSVNPGAETAVYPLRVVAEYDDGDGINHASAPMTAGVRPAPRQPFAVREVSVTTFGEDVATVQATIENTGDAAVGHAVATLAARDPGVLVTDGTAPIGSLAPGASATVTFQVRATPSADAGVHQFTTRVRYDRGGTASYRSAPISLRASLGGRAALDVLAVNNTLGIDASNRLTVRIVNRGPTAVEEVRATMLVGPPYSSDSPRAYVARLEPGESAILAFEVSTPGDAVATRTSLPVVINATTAAGRAVTIGPEPVPIVVRAPNRTAGSTTVLLVGAVVVAVLVGGLWWWLNRT